MMELPGLDEPLLPSGWARPRLSDIARLNPKTRVDGLEDNVEVNFIPMRSVEPEGGGILAPEVREYREVRKGYTSFLSGDIIAAKITPCMENGKFALVPELPGSICFGSTEFHVIRPLVDIESRWILYYLLQVVIRRDAQRAMTGAVGQMRVPVRYLEDLRIPLPPVQEQRRILDVIDELFTDLDSGRSALDRVAHRLTVYRSSVLKVGTLGELEDGCRATTVPGSRDARELIEDALRRRQARWEEDQHRRYSEKGVTPPKGWRERYPRPVAPDLADVPPLPDGWAWASLDQISEIAGGVTKGQKRSAAVRLRRVPYLRVANVQRGYLDLSEIKEIEASEEDIRALALKPGDVLFNEGGDRDKLGRGWVWGGEIPECIHQNHVFRARVLVPEIQPKLISWWGNSYGQLWFQRAGKQSVNLASLNMTVLRGFPIPIAPTDVQARLVESIDSQSSVIAHLEKDIAARIEATSSLRESILSTAFAGRLVAQDTCDEPVAQILERAAAQLATGAGGQTAQRRSRKARTTRQIDQIELDTE